MLREVKSSTGLIIVFGLAVILFGGIYTYYNVYTPDIPTSPSASNLIVPSDDATKGWLSFELKNLGTTFSYPNDWGEASASNGKARVETGYSYDVAFAKNKDISMGYASIDMSAGREGTLYEMININKNVSKIKDCSTYKQYTGNNYVTSCQDVTKAGKIVGIVTVLEYPDDGMTPGPYTVGYYFTSNSNYPVIGISANNKQETTIEIFKNIIKSFTADSTSSNANTPAASNLSNAGAWKNYSNTTYGFSLTFTDAWEGVKTKEVDLNGTLKTLYFNVPTTDSNYTTAQNYTFAGYAAPFAVSVIDKANWTGSDEQLMDFGSKIGENTNYVFTSGSWQACPTDLCNGAIASSIKQVTSSFKAL